MTEVSHLPTNKVRRKAPETAKHGLKVICQETNNPQLTLISAEDFHSPIIGISNHGGPKYSFIFLFTGHPEWAGEWREHIHNLNDRKTGREVDEEEDEDIGSSSEKDSSTSQK